MIDLLDNSTDVEAQRFAALSIANTCSAKLNRIQIVRHESTANRLIKYLSDENTDIVGKQYCAMALEICWSNQKFIRNWFISI